jgi:hypothetical protein
MGTARERRQSDRYTVDEFVVVVLPQGNAVGELRDVSDRGMFIALTTLQPGRGEAVVVRVNPSHAREAIELGAIVRWTSRRGIGVELGTVGSRERAVLASLVAKRSAS